MTATKTQTTVARVVSFAVAPVALHTVKTGIG
jgi:hypothetical protein